MQTHENVEIPRFLGADFAKTYTGRSLPSCGLMAGDLVCLRAASLVPDGCLAAVQDGEDTLLGRLFRINNGVALVPLDTACPARIFAEGQSDPPCIVGEVTGWVHSILPAESIQEGGGEL
jgi:SOS-response transcriptional repressor LexA